MTKLEQANTCRMALMALIDKVSHPALGAACKSVINHPKFMTAFGGTTHHAYEGGLAVHTFEVTSYAIQMAQMIPQANLDVLITAAVFHDYMKIREYEPKNMGSYAVPVKTPYRQLVRHVAGSHAEFLKAISGTLVPEGIVIAIEHAMLAHHGKYEHGSPIEPQLIEAYILHYADNFSKHFGEGHK
jgi:3'-5' exoribonuclease